MTTPAGNEGHISQGWGVMDAAGRALEYVGQLDRSGDLVGFERSNAQALALLDLRAGQRVLEIGSGTGAFALEMSTRVGGTGSVVGIDLTKPSMLVSRLSSWFTSTIRSRHFRRWCG